MRHALLHHRPQTLVMRHALARHRPRSRGQSRADMGRADLGRARGTDLVLALLGVALMGALGLLFAARVVGPTLGS